MPFLTFDQLTPAQAVVAQQHLAVNVAPLSLKKTYQREFLVIDGHVVGSRLRLWGRGEPKVSERDADNSLSKWTGGPERWSLDQSPPTHKVS